MVLLKCGPLWSKHNNFLCPTRSPSNSRWSTITRKLELHSVIVSGIPYLYTQTNLVESLLDKPNQENGERIGLWALQPERSDGLVGPVRASSCLYKTRRAADSKEPRYCLLLSLETKAVLFHLPISAFSSCKKPICWSLWGLNFKRKAHFPFNSMPNCHWFYIKYKSTTQFGFSPLCFKIQTIHNGLTKWVISMKYYKP